MMQENRFSDLDIAIVGISCRFPGAGNWKQYWRNLIEGKELVHFLNEVEISQLGVDERVRVNPNFVGAMSVLSEKYFDHHFFDYRYDEARLMNPQHRIFHECVWEALEDSGSGFVDASMNVGVFAGAGQDLSWQVHTNLAADKKVDSFTLSQINNKDFLASLISYKLGLKGPAISVNTACSTSAVAVHLACRSLLLGECALALAGGISLFSEKAMGYIHEEGMILSKDGHCRAFDANASGTIIGEGAGVVLLKRIKDAIRDKDHIYAIVKGSAINNDGNRKVGYSAPSINGQVDCIRSALKFSKVNPATVSFVEAHGTGTPLGDPIEVAALNIAYATNAQCAIGSVKTNIGHLDAAAGIAGIIKAVLSLYHKKLPPSLNFNCPNPEIPFAGGPFFVNTTLRDLERKDPSTPLRAGVSSFGIGGTNVHIILEEFTEPKKNSKPPRLNILPLSAKDEQGVVRYTKSIASQLEQDADIDIVGLCYTFQKGRKKFNFRKSFIFQGKEDLLRKLNSSYDITIGQVGITEFSLILGDDVVVWQGYGRDLYRHIPDVHLEVEKGTAVLRSLVDLEFHDITLRDDDGSILNDLLAICHFSLVRYAICSYIIRIGLTPASIVAFGSGEIIAGVLSGVFDLDFALKLLLTRLADSNPSYSRTLTEAGFKLNEAKEFIKSSVGFRETKFHVKTPALKNSSFSSVEYWKNFVDSSKAYDLHAFESELTSNNEARLRIGPFGSKIPFKGDPSCIDFLLEPAPFGDEQKSLCLIFGELWEKVDGVNLNGLYDANVARKVPVPTYPFSQIKFPYYVDAKQLLAGLGKIKSNEKAEKLENYFYQAYWQQSPHALTQETIVMQPVLVFSNGHPIGSLAKYFDSIVNVTIGQSFSKIDAHCFTIDPTNEQHYLELFTQLKSMGYQPANIVHTWTHGIEADERIETLGFHALLNIVRSFIAVFESTPVRFGVVSNNLFSIFDGDRLTPKGGIILGASRVIPKEFANVSVKVVDSDILGEPLSFELRQHPYDGTEIALRGRKKFTRAFRNMVVHPVPPGRVFQSGKTYLLTGASGGMAGFFAEYLSKHIKANLVLISRSPLPDEMLIRLQAHGAKVIFIQANVCDVNLKFQIQKAIEKTGGIHGVIHAAGVLDFFGSILKRSQKQNETILEPKVSGTLNLWSALRSHSLDFFVNCSSLSATTAPFGEVAYVAANAFLDHFAEAYNEHHNTISIQWCTLSETGGAVRSVSHLPQDEQKFALELGITSQEALEILSTAIHYRIPNPIISTISLEHRLKPVDSVDNDIANEVEFSKRPPMKTEFRQATTSFEMDLLKVVETFVGISGLGIDDNFFELAGDSLKAMLLIKRIEKRFGVTLTLKDFFDLQTFAEIAKKIEKKKSKDPSKQTGSELQGKQLIDPHIRMLSSLDNNKKILFLIPGSHGLVENYNSLAKALGTTYSVVGLQMFGSLHSEHPLYDMEIIADKNIALMKQIQPSGPYRIIGHSFGAHAGFEVARKLESKDEVVEFVCFLDAPAGCRRRNDPKRNRILAKEIICETVGVMLNSSASVNFLHKLDRILEENGILESKNSIQNLVKEVLPHSNSEETEFIFKALWLRLVNELIDYPIPGKIKSKIITISALESNQYSSDPTLGWSPYSTQEIETFQVGGDHFTMTDEINSLQIANCLEASVIVS